MSSALLDIGSKRKKSSDVIEDIDSGEILPQYELKNEEFEVENVGSLSKKDDISKFSHSDFNMINNEHFTEINIFGHKEVINLAENSDTITNRLCLKYDVPFLALKNIVEMKRKEAYNKEKAKTIAYPEDCVARNKMSLISKNKEYFKSDMSHNLNNKVNNFEDFSGLDIFIDKKQYSEKGGYSNKNINLDKIHKSTQPPVGTSNNNYKNNLKEGKLKEVSPNSNLFTIDNLFDGNSNGKKGLFSKNGTSSKKSDIKKSNNNLLSESKKENIKSNKNVSQSISHCSASTFSLSSSCFLGERLYRKNIALESQKKRKNEQIKKQVEESKRQECNFVPKTNPLNNLFGVEIKSKFQEKKIEKNLFPDEKIEVSPKKINLSSAEAEKLFAKLHREKISLENQKTLDANLHFSQYKFTPEINEKSKPVLQNFYKRLQEWILKKTEKERDDFEKAKYDDKTGQELFHPIISKKSMEIQKKDVWEELYREKNYLVSTKKELISQQEKEFIKSNKTKLISDQSEQIINQLKHSIFSKIFTALDNDGDKLVTYNDFNNKNLPDNILFILNGISQNIKENSEKLSEDDFIKSMQQIDQALNYEEKSKIFIWFHHNFKLSNSAHCVINENNIEKFPFKPEPSKKSEELYHKSCKHNKNFLTRNTETVKSKEQFIMTKKNELDELEIKECTFSPRNFVKEASLNNPNALSKKTIAKTGTIVSKNTNACTNRTGDLKTINIEENLNNKPALIHNNTSDNKTINLGDINQAQNEDNQALNIDDNFNDVASKLEKEEVGEKKSDKNENNDEEGEESDKKKNNDKSLNEMNMQTNIVEEAANKNEKGDLIQN